MNCNSGEPSKESNWGARDYDAGDLGSLTSNELKKLLLQEREQLKELERENRELKGRISALCSNDLHKKVFKHSPFGHLLINGEMLIVEVNLTAKKTLGRERSALLSTPFTYFLADESRADFYQALHRLKESGIQESCEVILRRGPSHIVAKIEMAIVPRREDLFAIGFVDITFYKEKEKGLQENIEHLCRFFDEAKIGLNIIDETMRYVKVNEYAAKNIGRSEEEILGQSIYSLVPGFANEIEGSFKRILKKEKIEESLEVAGALPGREEERVYWRSTHFSFALANGRPGIGVVAMDITDFKAAEEKLKEAQELNEGILENLPDPTMVVNRQGRVLMWNKAMEDLTGVVKDEMKGKRASTYALPFFGKPQPLLLNLLLQPEEEAKKGRGRYESFHASGEKIAGEFYAKGVYGGKGAYLWTLATTIRSSKGEIIGAIETFRDITDLRKTKDLIMFHQRFLSILESIDALVYVIDMETYEILYMNSSSKEIFGQQEGQLCWEIFHEGQRRPCSFCSMDQLLDKDGSPSGIFTLEKYEPRNGCWYQSRIQAIRWIDGKMVRLELATEITRRKKAEEDLQESDLRFRKFLEGFQGIAYQISEVKGGAQFFLPALFYGLVEEITGFRAKDFLEGKIIWQNLVHPDDAMIFRSEAMKLWKTKEYVANNKYRILHRDGSIRWIRDIAKRVETNNVFTIQGTIYDITQQKETEEKLQATLSKLQALLNNSPNAISIFDKKGRYVVVSNAAANIFGLSQEELVGKSFEELLPPSIASDFMETIACMQEKQETIFKTDRILGEEGERIFETWLFPVEIKDGVIELIGAISMDITHRMQTERALQESENRFRQMADSIEEVFWLFSLKEKRFLYISPAYETIWGRAREELMEDFYPSLRETIFEEDRIILKEALKGLKHGKPLDIEFRIIRPDGEISWIHTRSFFIHDEEGKVIRNAGISLDITKQKEAQEKAIEASKAKSEFLSSVSHELRTPLHAILSYADIGLEESREHDLEEISNYFHIISICGHRLTRLINDLLDISKIEAGEMRYDFHKEDAYKLIALFKRELEEILKKKEIALKIDPPSSPCIVSVDRDRILQIMRNVIENASKFSPSNSQITILLEKREGPTPAVAITIIDEGIGIPEDDLESIFHKFYQVNREGIKKEGTGLGLSICYEIIKAHGGTIYATNTEDRGAAITFTLPLL